MVTPGALMKSHCVWGNGKGKFSAHGGGAGRHAGYRAEPG